VAYSSAISAYTTSNTVAKSYTTAGDDTQNIAPSTSSITVGGDYATPCYITVTGASPTSTSFTNNAESITVAKALLADEQLLIDTTFGQRSIKFKDVPGVITNAMQYLSIGSKFFQLAVGNNLIGFSGTNAVITYRERYIGL
jgi:phage-related protein